MPAKVKIVSVSVGQPQPLRQLKTTTVYSSIVKRTVRQPEILLTWTNLLGDQQVDTKPKLDGRQLHGGNGKAIYVFPDEHYDNWAEVYARDFTSPYFGENLCIKGLTESEVRIGDRWQWGSTVLEVAEPRQPCYKLGYHLGDEVVDQMWDTGWCGWYLRVAEKPGLVPTSGEIQIVHVATGAPTIAEIFEQKRNKNR